MKTKYLLLLFTAISIATVAELRADDAAVLQLTIPPAKKAKIQIPAGWDKSVMQPDVSLPPTVRFVHAADAKVPFVLLTTFIPDAQGKFATPDAVDELVKGANEKYVDGSVEKKQTLVKLTSKSGYGSYAVFTDADLAGVAELKPGQFRYVASGVFVIKGVAVAFTYLTNDLKAPEFEQALKFLQEGITIE